MLILLRPKKVPDFQSLPVYPGEQDAVPAQAAPEPALYPLCEGPMLTERPAKLKIVQ
jgi:hypothetical protein